MQTIDQDPISFTVGAGNINPPEPKVIDKIRLPGLSIDVYNDGDCLFLDHPEGFFVLSQELLNRMTAGKAKSKPATTPAAAPIAVVVADSTAKPKPVTRAARDKAAAETTKLLNKAKGGGSTTKPVNSATTKPESKLSIELIEPEPKIHRRYQKLEGNEGWECILRGGDLPDERHVYETREQARNAQRSTPVGTLGRRQ